MRTPTFILALSLVGCAHMRSASDPANPEATSTVIEAKRVVPGSPMRPDGAVNPIYVVWVSDVVAVEETTSNPGMGPLCGDTDVDPPHVCPGTTPAPSSPPDSSSSPPPPPD